MLKIGAENVMVDISSKTVDLKELMRSGAVDLKELMSVNAVPLPDDEYVQKAQDILAMLFNGFSTSSFDIKYLSPKTLEEGERVVADYFVIDNAKRSLSVRVTTTQHFAITTLRLSISRSKKLYAVAQLGRNKFELGPHDKYIEYEGAFMSFASRMLEQ